MKINIDLIYPIGAVYISTNSLDPSIVFGGEWRQIKDTFLLASGDTYSVGSSGGESEHKLTVAELANHTHIATSYYDDANYNHGTIPTDYGKYSIPYDSGNNIRHQEFGSSGDNQPHNNMPPYLVVCIWERIG